MDELDFQTYQKRIGGHVKKKKIKKKKNGNIKKFSLNTSIF